MQHAREEMEDKETRVWKENNWEKMENEQ